MWVERIQDTKSSLMVFSSDNLKDFKKVDISEFGGYLTIEEYREILEDGCFVASSRLQELLLSISIADLTSYHRKVFMKTHIELEENKRKD